MSDLYLGIDTSNYTTSVAVTDSEGRIYADERRILEVKAGDRGLRQSDAFYQHVQNLPSLYEAAIDKIIDAGLKVSDIKGVCVSTRPRNVTGSYMPVFTAGKRFAEVISKTLGLPLKETTHQDGHIKAIEEYNMAGDNFICFHISGGTMEILKVDKNSDNINSDNINSDDLFHIEIIGKSLDLSIGQVIDRAGVAMGYQFPCGAAMDKKLTELDIKPDKKAKLGGKTIKDIPVKNLEFNLSGIETQIARYIDSNQNEKGLLSEEAENEVLQLLFTKILLCLQKLVKNCKEQYNDYKIIFAGGVSQSRFIREHMKEDIIFGDYGADNAIGVALLGR